MDVYAKADIPDRYHFRDNDLILDILMVSKGTNLVEAEDEGGIGANPDEVYLPRRNAYINVGNLAFNYLQC